MSTFKMDYLNMRDHIRMAELAYEKGSNFDDLIAMAYIQGMIDKEVDSMEDDDWVAREVVMICTDSDDYVEVEIITADEAEIDKLENKLEALADENND